MTHPVEETSAKLWGGRWAIWTLGFLLFFSAAAVSGVVMVAGPSLSLLRYYIMKGHIWVGYGGLIVLLPLTLVHLFRLYPRKAALWTVGSVLLFFGMLFSQMRAYEQFWIPAAVMVFVTVRYLLPGGRWASWVVILGVVSLATLVMCYSSGGFIAGPVRTLRTNLFNDVHKWSGLAATALVPVHLLYRYGFREDRLWGWKAAGVGVFALAMLGLAYWDADLLARKVAMKYDATASASTEYGSDEGTGKYGDHYGGQYLVRSPGRGGCGDVGCHTEIHKQWSVSLHRFSAENLPYRKVLELFREEQGEGAESFCHHCHDPGAALNKYVKTDSEDSDGSGLFCRACHLIESVSEPPVNGEYAWGGEIPYLPGYDKSSGPVAAVYHDFVRTDLRAHRASYQRDLYRQGEYCAACHRLRIPGTLNGREDLWLEGQFESWKESAFADNGVGCVHCHMQLHRFDDPESIESSFHARPDHRFFGIQAHLGRTLPPGSTSDEAMEEFTQATNDWIAGRLDVSKYEQLFLSYTRDGRARAFEYFKDHPLMDISVSASTIGESVGITVRTSSGRIGHRFPSALLDLAEIWMEITVEDDGGRIQFHRGGLTETGEVDPAAARLGAKIVDKDGRAIRFHRVWAAAEIQGERFLIPGQSIEDVYRIPSVGLSGATIDVNVRWFYRRYNPDFAEWVFGPAWENPVVELASLTERVEIRNP